MEDSRAAEPGEWLRDVAAHTAGKVRVHLSPDWSVGFPVEVVVGGNPGYVGPCMLGITDALARDLQLFQSWWEEHSSFDDETDDETDTEEETDEKTEDGRGWSQWHREGRRLVDRLQAELGPSCDVVWIGMQEP